MPKRSNRLIYCFWDDRDETVWSHFRRKERQRELFADLSPLDTAAETWVRRTLYTYGRCARARGFRLAEARPNNLFVRTQSRYSPGRAANEYPLLRRAMAALVACWEPYVCGVRTKALDALIRDPGPFRAAWMLYVHPPLAGTVVTPDVPVVEREPDGGLFLAATVHPFSCDDPAHLAAAQRIAAAVAHLNVERPLVGATPANPWPPTTNRFVGEHDRA